MYEKSADLGPTSLLLFWAVVVGLRIKTLLLLYQVYCAVQPVLLNWASSKSCQEAILFYFIFKYAFKFLNTQLFKTALNLLF